MNPTKLLGDTWQRAHSPVSLYSATGAGFLGVTGHTGQKQKSPTNGDSKLYGQTALRI